MTSFRSYLESPDGIAQIRAITSRSGINAATRNVTELKNKWAAIGSIPHGQTDCILVHSPGFDAAVVVNLVYSAINNSWYSEPFPIYSFNLQTGRATAAAAAIGTKVVLDREQFLWLNYSAYTGAGLTAQMSMYATGVSNTAGAFPIARFRATTSSTNPVNVAAPTPANLLALSLVTGAVTSSGMLGWTDVTVGGGGSHLWGDACFEVGGAAALITGTFMRVDLRWKV